jgi:hypothetical protein
MSIGFDQNNDASSNILAFVNNQWEQCFIKGAAMIRPYFGQKATVGLTDINQSEPIYHPYPNPASQQINIQSSDSEPIKSVEMFNAMGKMVYGAKNSNIIDVTTLPNGIYILKIYSQNNRTSLHKVIVNH